jgi:lysophospholipase L1-like esterase
MSGADRSWTIAPTILWFSAGLIAAVWAIDGDPRAIAGRLVAKRTPVAAPAAGSFTSKPIVVADAKEDVPVAPIVVPGPDRSKGILEDTCLEGTNDACKRWAMDGFYKSLAAARTNKLGRALRASWYGDSVVANDEIPGRLREKLQAELGDGGPGFIYVVEPHRFNGHEAITRSHSGDWMTHAISTVQVADGFYGVGGSTTETSDGKAVIKLVAGTASKLDLYFLAQPKGGTAIVAADGTEVLRAETKADAKAPGYAAKTLDGGAKKFEVTTEGRTRMFGLDLENDRGAVVDNLGVVSVNVKSWANSNQDHWTLELAHRDADLILIMIGANEAQWLGPNDADTKLYQANYEKLLAPMRKALPNGSCLVVSPTDQAEAKDGEYPSRPVMPVLVNAQRKAAHAQGCAFFSTYDWMGGKGSAAKWFARGLVGSDFQHMSKKGANKMGDAVYDALEAGMKNARP